MNYILVCLQQRPSKVCPELMKQNLHSPKLFYENGSYTTFCRYGCGNPVFLLIQFHNKRDTKLYHEYFYKKRNMKTHIYYNRGDLLIKPHKNDLQAKMSLERASGSNIAYTKAYRVQHLTFPPIMSRDHHSGAQMSLNERYDTIMKAIVSS